MLKFQEQWLKWGKIYKLSKSNDPSKPKRTNIIHLVRCDMWDYDTETLGKVKFYILFIKKDVTFYGYGYLR